MNILHISTAKSWRGGERQVQYLIDGLEKSGESNFLMSPKGSILSERCGLPSTKKLEYKKGVFSLFKNINSLNDYCKTHKIDIIHGHDSHAHTLLWFAYRFGHLTPKSLVTRRLLFSIKNRSKSKYNYPKIKQIICISKAVHAAVQPSIEDTSRLVVIHSGIDISKRIVPKAKRSEIPEIIIGYVAAFTKEKDHHTFILTAKNLINNYPQLKFKFLLAGDGPLLNVIKKESQSIIDKIEFTGFIEDVKKAYLKMDILLHTSKSEALGTSILDAMKYGIPIVATNIGGIPEIVKHGQNGFLCTVGDYQQMSEYIYLLATDEKVYRNYSIANSEILVNFDIPTMVKKTSALYHKILNQ